MRLHGRPFGRDDAVDYSVAQRAVRRNLMVAQDPVLLGAEAFAAAPALVVEEMRAELYRNAIERFECVRKQPPLPLGIERAALPTPALPGRPNRHPPLR